MSHEEDRGQLDPIGGGDPIKLGKNFLRVGRRSSADVCLKFPNVSSNHAELKYEQGYWTIRDCGSSNGIKVNGVKVMEKRVYPGDEVAFASHRFKLNYVPQSGRGSVAEVEDLHEDIMKFSLLERAGLTTGKSDEPKSPKPPKPQPNRPYRPQSKPDDTPTEYDDDEDFMKYLNDD